MTSPFENMPDKIVCTRCAAEFTSLFANEQAYGCASELRGDEIRGHYGSAAFDGDVGYLADGAAHGLSDGIICDTCIESMLAAGVLIRRE